MAQMLEGRIREHLKQRGNLFSEGSSALAASLSRPLLCLFDRNYELSVVTHFVLASSDTSMCKQCLL